MIVCVSSFVCCCAVSVFTQFSLLFWKKIKKNKAHGNFELFRSLLYTYPSLRTAVYFARTHGLIGIHQRAES